jgi:hypothetical protein
MDDAVAMRFVERIGDLHGVVERLVRRERSAREPRASDSPSRAP